MAVTTFIPEIWAARLQYALEKNHVATAFVNRSYEGQIKSAGDTVHINTISAVSVRSYTPGTAITVDSLTTTDTTLVINQNKYYAFAVEDVDKVQASGDLIDAAMSRAAYALNDTADAFIFATLAAGGTALTTLKIDATNVYKTIVNMRLEMDKKNVPTAGRNLAVSPEVYALLLQDDRFTKVAAKSEEVVRNGMVGNVAGFTVYESNNLSGNLIASTTAGCTYAEQILKTEAMRQEDQFADLVRGQHVYGAKVTDANQIIVQPYTV